MLLSTKCGGTFQEEEFKRTTKLKITAGLNAQAGSLGTSYDANLHSSFEYETTSSFHDRNTFEQRDKQDSEVKDIQKQNSEQKIIYGPHDGFIRSRLIIKNSTPQEVTVRQVSYDFVEINSCSGGAGSTNSLGSGIIQTVNLVQGIPQGPGTVTSKPAESLEVKIPANAAYSQQVYIPDLDTNFITTAMQRHNPIQLKINSFLVKVNGDESLKANDIQQMDRVELDLVTPDGNSVYFVRPTILEFGKISLETALKRVANSVSFEKLDGRRVIAELNGRRSNFHGPSSTADGNAGRWLAESSKINWQDIDESVPLGTKFVVVWMTKDELAAPQNFSLTIPVTKADAPQAHAEAAKRYSLNTDFVPIACLGVVKQGDTIRVRVAGAKITHKARSEFADCGLQGPRGAWATNNYVDDESTPIDGKNGGLSEFELYISLHVDSDQVKLVPIASVVPACGYTAYPDGRAEVEFVVDDQLLPEKQGELCFVSPLRPKRMFVGRYADRKSFCYAVWYVNQPGSDKDFFDHNKLTINGQVLHTQ